MANDENATQVGDPNFPVGDPPVAPEDPGPTPADPPADTPTPTSDPDVPDPPSDTPPPEDDPPADAPAETDDEPTPEEERATAAEAQNLPEGAVPEQRPQAFTQLDPSDAESDLTKQLKESGEIPDDTVPMPQEAYDRANSDEAKEEAAKNSVEESIFPGSTVEITDGPHEGRIFAVTRILNDSNVADVVRRAAGSPAQLYNEVQEFEGRAMGDERDGELVILNADRDKWKKLDEGWRGTRAGRRH